MNWIRYNVYMLLVAAVCFALGACGGEEGDSMPEAPQVPANPDALCAITPHAVEINQVEASATPITRSATGKPEQKVTYAENLGANYSAEATLEAVPQEAQTRATGNLATGAQYRIVAYDDTGKIVGNVVYMQGSSAVVSGETIKLKEGTYRLFAYTFNSAASAIRGLDADNKNVTVNSGEDFMTYTVASYTVTSTDYSRGKQLNINFVRQFARLTVTVIVEGYTDNTITAASLAVGNVFGSGSKWNGTTHTDAATLASVAGTASLTKATGNASSIDCGLAANNPYLNTSPCNNQPIRVSGLSVTIQGVGTKTLPEFNFPTPVTLVKGGSYRLTIYTGNYYILTRTNPVTIGGLKWARTNLQQTGAGTSAPVSFVDNPWDYGSDWHWGMRDATLQGANDYLSAYAYWNNATPGHTNQDPCRSLGSGWHLPTKGELENLVNNKATNGTKVRIKGIVNTINEYGWAPDAKAAVYISGNQVISLPAVSDNNTKGIYWSNHPEYDYSWFALALYFRSDINKVAVGNPRMGSNSLRCIQE